MTNKEMEMKAREHDVSDVNVETVAEVTSEVMEAAAGELVNGYKTIEKGVVDGYKKIEKGVVDGYKKIETGAVEGFGKVVDKCVEVLFSRDGETVEEAKSRLSRNNRE